MYVTISTVFTWLNAAPLLHKQGHHLQISTTAKLFLMDAIVIIILILSSGTCYGDIEILRRRQCVV